jgi:hypothetical protein
MTEYVDSMGIYVPVSGVDASSSQASLLTRYNGIGTGNHQLGIHATGGLRGNPVLYVPFGGSIFKTVSHQPTYTAGFNVNMSTTGGVGNGDLFKLLNNNTIMCTLRVNLDGSIVVYAFNSQSSWTILTTSALLNPNEDNYIELQATCSVYATNKLRMFAEVWVNGVSQGSNTIDTTVLVTTLVTQTGIFGTDPIPMSPSVFNRVGFLSGVVTNGAALFSDFYLNNALGSTNTGTFGIVEIDAYPLPDGDGSVLQWTPLGGSGTQYSQINVLPAPGDTSYLSSSTPGQRSSFTWQDIVSFSGTVKTVQLSYSARSNDEGLRTFQSTIGSTGTEEQGTEFGLPNDYIYFHQCFDLDPATGLPWTVTNFNAKQFGIGLVQ